VLSQGEPRDAAVNFDNLRIDYNGIVRLLLGLLRLGLYYIGNVCIANGVQFQHFERSLVFIMQTM